MKLILDFENSDGIKITATDDPDNFYLLGYKENKYSLWFNDSFVWEKEYETTGHALASVVGSLANAMKKFA